MGYFFFFEETPYFWVVDFAKAVMRAADRGYGVGKCPA